MTVRRLFDRTKVRLVEIKFDGSDPVEHVGWASLNPDKGLPFVLQLDEKGESLVTEPVTEILSSPKSPDEKRIVFKVGQTTYELIFPVISP